MMGVYGIVTDYYINVCLFKKQSFTEQLKNSQIVNGCFLAILYKSTQMV